MGYLGHAMTECSRPGHRLGQSMGRVGLCYGKWTQCPCLECSSKVKGKGAYSSLWIGNPSQSYGASPAIWDHTVLPATRHRWTRPALTQAMQARFTYPGGIGGWVDLGVGYILRWFTCPQTVTYPGTNHLIETRPGDEHTTSRSQVERPNRYIVTLSYLEKQLCACSTRSRAGRTAAISSATTLTEHRVQRFEWRTASNDDNNDTEIICEQFVAATHYWIGK